jgi:hypothetical protein
MKNDLTTGAWQHNVGCPISIMLLSTSDAGGTNNNLLKAQVRPAHNGDKDDTPGMYLAVVVVAAMMVWKGGAQWQW